ncbi:MAG: hypothetical protein K0B08_09060 [Bacteroidales bacterium]|nr:hypothetical protein [Bacteroidales bacterium]
MVTDILGRVMVQTAMVLDKGKHSFRFKPGNGNLYFFAATWQGRSSSIKILHSGFYSGGAATLEYTGSEDYFPQLKAIEDIRDFSFTPGDELLYIGYANGWLKENFNVGDMIPGIMEQSNNETIEKYCYNNDTNNCISYGGLYQWNEMMQYTTQQGAQGICPPGWHIPTDEEWKVLEGAVDSQYGIGNNIWNNLGHRGSDAGTNLKTESGWNGNGNGTDLYGFAGLPGGYRYLYAGNHFYDIGSFGYWWTSTASSPYASSSREIRFYSQGIVRTDFYTVTGYSVRCLRDE